MEGHPSQTLAVVSHRDQKALSAPLAFLYTDMEHPMQLQHNDDLSYNTKLFLERCRANEPPHCQVACPLHIDNRRMARLIAAGRFKEALAVCSEWESLITSKPSLLITKK